MRYSLNTAKTINQLVPHFFKGRNVILYLQSICRPLQTVNDAFVEWALDKRIEASMTSQIIMIEWYLNKKFSKYYVTQTDRMTISDIATNGVPIYWESNKQQEPFVVYKEGETVGSKPNKPLHYIKEAGGLNYVSFLVCSPKINTDLISKEEYTSMVSSIINKYKIAGKTYQILIN